MSAFTGYALENFGSPPIERSSLVFRALKPFATTVVKIACRYDCVLWIEEFVTGFEHKTLIIYNEFHLPGFPGKQDVPKVRMLAFGPASFLILKLAAGIATLLPLLFDRFIV